MKKINKLMAMLICLAMLAVGITGCGTPAETADTPTDAQESEGGDGNGSAGDAEESMDNGGDKTIGVVFYSKTDALGSVVYALVNEAAKTWGVNVKWEIGGLDNDTQLNSIQNLISGGVDGIMIIPLADAVTQKTSEMCEKAGVYFSLCFRDIIDEDIRKQVIANPYFVGMVFEADYDMGKEMIRLVAEQGCTNAGVGYNSPTVPYEKQVTAGFNEGMEEYGVKKLAEFTLSDSGDVNVSTSNIENFLNAFPDMDVIVSGSASVGVGEASVELLRGTNVKLATKDFFSGMEEAFNDGTLAAACGGTGPDALYSFAMCYNAVEGTPLSDSYISCQQKYIFLKSAEECQAYEKYFGSDLSHIGDVYSAEYLNSLVKANNESLNEENLQALIDEYSMEWIMEQVE